MRTGKSSQYAVRRGNWIVLVGVIIVVAAMMAAPVYSERSGSQQRGDRAREGAGAGKVVSGEGGMESQIWQRTEGMRPFLAIASPPPETIETYAADCTTPRNSFVVGETVCAKTTNVTESDRFVNWLSPPASEVAYGGAGVTDITTDQAQDFLYTPTTVGLWKVTIADGTDSSIIAAEFTVVSETAPLATYNGACQLTQTSFSLGDSVCAIVTGVNPGLNRRLFWIDPAGNLRAATAVTSDPQSDTYTLPATETTIVGDTVVDNRGTWKVNIVTSRGSAVNSVTFTVSGTTAAADLGVTKTIVGDDPASGANFTYFVAVTNNGPNNAANVVFTDPQPENASYVSITQTSGPTSPGFTCTGSNPVVCTRASLGVGETATFDLVYTAGSTGTITNTATIASDTADLNGANDSGSYGPVAINEGGGGEESNCTLNCPNDIIVTAASPSGTVVDFSEGFGIAGNCGTVTSSPASGTLFPVGSTTVTATSSEGGGTCSFTVQVIDTPAPTITCPLPTLTAEAGAGQTETTVSVSPPSATGTCVTVAGSRDDEREVSDAYPVGTTVITWTATETLGGCPNGTPGRTASCSQTVIVTSPPGDAPTITCPADKTFSTADCAYTATGAEIGTPSSTGSGVTVAGVRSDHQLLSEPFPAGTTIITWTATDDVGRVVSCNQTITVNSSGDATAPTLHTPANITVTTNTCTAVLDDELGVATAEDSCSAVSITRTGVPTFSCPTPENPSRQCESFVFPTGTTNVTYTATDGSGNVTVGVQQVTVHESPDVPPSFTFVPASLTVNTGAGAISCGAFVGDATLGTATATDNCGGVTVTRAGVPAGNNFPVGLTTITYTATDASGNTVQATQDVTVIDNTLPVITSVPSGGQTDAGSCTATIPDVVTGTVATDNCGAITVTQVPLAGTAVGLGTHTVTVRATDSAGNFSEATTTFTVNALQFDTRFWLGLKNSDDVGTKFDLRAEVRKNNVLVGSAEIYGVPGGSSGFNNATERSISAALSSTGFCTSDALSVTLLVRVAANSGHVSGTARLWYNDSAANSRFNRVVNGVTTSYYLRKISNNLVLDGSTGPLPKLTIDVLVNRNQNGNPFKPFGTWTKTF